MIQSFFFYLCALLSIFSGIMVISCRNPVHSVLFLILAFFNVAILFILLGAEFLAMILLIVYIGAVVVLFLFVVMMLDINFVALRQGFLRYLPLGFAVALILLSELAFGIFSNSFLPEGHGLTQISALSNQESSNTQSIGLLLYTEYVYLFQISGLILLLAMIGAITLSLRHKSGVRRQNIADQVARTKDECVEIRKVPSGKGI